METTLAILMALGIYLGIPLVIAFAIGGIFIMSGRRVKRAERAKAAAEAEVVEPVKAPAEVGAGEVTR